MKTLHILLAAVFSMGILFSSQAFALRGASDLGDSSGSNQMLTPGDESNPMQEPGYSNPGGETQPYYGEEPSFSPQIQPYYGEEPGSPDQSSPEYQFPTPDKPNGESQVPTIPFTQPTDVPGAETG